VRMALLNASGRRDAAAIGLKSPRRKAPSACWPVTEAEQMFTFTGVTEQPIAVIAARLFPRSENELTHTPLTNGCSGSTILMVSIAGRRPRAGGGNPPGAGGYSQAGPPWMRTSAFCWNCVSHGIGGQQLDPAMVCGNAAPCV